MNWFSQDFSPRICVRAALQGRAACRSFFSILLVATATSGCAVPIPPSGGPEDSAPPVLMISVPGNASVNVSTDRIIFQFNERIDERSIIGALSIFPEFSQPVEIDYKGERIEIQFPEPLLPNTTYIVTLDNRFRDAHNVALKQPISIAFGTGSTLNTGRVKGEIVDALRGKPVGGADIFLYPAHENRSVDLRNEKPVYRIQANESGVFTLSNLREQNYFILGLLDRNQNRLLDINEPFAVVREVFTVSDSVTTQIETPFVLSILDEEGPEIRQARSTFTDEILLRFSEAVRVTKTALNDWAVSDSASGKPYRVKWTYPGASAREVILRMERSVDPDNSEILNQDEKAPEKIIRLSGRGPIADSSGNHMLESIHYMRFSTTVRVDSVIFAGFLPDTSNTRNPDGHLLLWPGDSVGIHFESPLPSPENESWDKYVSISDTSGNTLSISRHSQDGVNYIISGATRNGNAFEGPFELSVTVADSTYSESFVRAGPELLGELSAVMDMESELDLIRVELYRDRTPYALIQVVGVKPDGSFRFPALPGGSEHFIRAFVDSDGDGRWSPGRTNPFRPPEPIFWYEVAQKVRARWETVIPDTLRMPTLN